MQVDSVPWRYLANKGDAGWLRLIMETLNATWPHPDHLLVNHGIPGHSVGGFANGVCFEPGLPQRVDLVIIENLAGSSSAQGDYG